MTDYERGVEQASAIYKEVIREYVAENAKLLKELEAEHALAEMLGHCHEHAQAENAELRELVRDMMRFFEDGDYCTACEKVAECDAREEYDDSCLMRGVFHARMRELGVEQ